MVWFSETVILNGIYEKKIAKVGVMERFHSQRWFPPYCCAFCWKDFIIDTFGVVVVLVVAAVALALYLSFCPVGGCQFFFFLPLSDLGGMVRERGKEKERYP